MRAGNTVTVTIKLKNLNNSLVSSCEAWLKFLHYLLTMENADLNKIHQINVFTTKLSKKSSSPENPQKIKHLFLSNAP